MKHALIPDADWYDQTRLKLERVRTEADLNVCAPLLDGYEFQALPDDKQKQLAVLFSDAYFRTTGAMI